MPPDLAANWKSNSGSKKVRQFAVGSTAKIEEQSALWFFSARTSSRPSICRPRSAYSPRIGIGLVAAGLTFGGRSPGYEGPETDVAKLLVATCPQTDSMMVRMFC